MVEGSALKSYENIPNASLIGYEAKPVVCINMIMLYDK